MDEDKEKVSLFKNAKERKMFVIEWERARQKILKQIRKEQMERCKNEHLRKTGAGSARIESPER